MNINKTLIKKSKIDIITISKKESKKGKVIKMKQNIIIGGAWPYANSSLHLGHIAGLMSGDVLARYYRLKGDNVYYMYQVQTHMEHQ